MRNISTILWTFLMSTTLVLAMDSAPKDFNEIYGELLHQYPTLSEDIFTDVYLAHEGNEWAIKDHFSREREGRPRHSLIASPSATADFGIYPGSSSSYAREPKPTASMHHGPIGYPSMHPITSFPPSYPSASSYPHLPSTTSSISGGLTPHPLLHPASFTPHSPYMTVSNTNASSSHSPQSSFSLFGSESKSSSSVSNTNASSSHSPQSSSSLFGSESKSFPSVLHGKSVIDLIYEKIDGPDTVKFYSIDGEMLATALTPEEMGVKPCTTFYKKCFEEILSNSLRKHMELTMSYSHSLQNSAEMELTLKMMELKLGSAEVIQGNEDSEQAFHISLAAFEKARELFETHSKEMGVLRAQIEELEFANLEIRNHLKLLAKKVLAEQS